MPPCHKEQLRCGEAPTAGFLGWAIRSRPDLIPSLGVGTFLVRYSAVQTASIAQSLVSVTTSPSALSHCRIEGIVALSHCRIEGIVALKHCRIVALKHCRIVALSHCRIVALSHCRIPYSPTVSLRPVLTGSEMRPDRSGLRLEELRRGIPSKGMHRLLITPDPSRLTSHWTADWVPLGDPLMGCPAGSGRLAVRNPNLYSSSLRRRN